MAMAVAAVVGTAASQASVIPSVVNVPIEAAAIAADPALANYKTYDLRVTISAGDHWSSADMQSAPGTLGSSTPGAVGAITHGQFYAPPSTLSGAADADVPQRAVYNIVANRNYKYDTWTNTIPNLANADGDFWGNSGIFNSQGATYPVNHGSSASVLPRTTDNPNVAGGADLGLHVIDIAWGDTSAGTRTYPTPGTYTIARVTTNDTGGDWLLGRVGSTSDPNNSVPFSFQIPGVPEPTSLALIGLGLGAIALRRRSQ